MARGQELAFPAGQRAVVHAELHLDRRRIEIDEWQRLALLAVAQRLADVQILEAGRRCCPPHR